MIAVTFALPAESLRFLRSLHNKRRSDRNGIKTVSGEISDHAIEVFHTGVGEKVCRRQMRKFLQDREFDCLISAGFAGALDDQLHVGDLLLARNFSTVELSAARSALSSLSIHTADLLTLPSMIQSGEERNKIAQPPDVAAVDMETEFIARACAERAIPLLSLRVITDTPREPFPAPAKVLFDIEQQRTDLARLAAFFFTHPGRIPHLSRFTGRIARTRKVLANALV